MLAAVAGSVFRPEPAIAGIVVFEAVLYQEEQHLSKTACFVTIEVNPFRSESTAGEPPHLRGVQV